MIVLEDYSELSDPSIHIYFAYTLFLALEQLYSTSNMIFDEIRRSVFFFHKKIRKKLSRACLFNKIFELISLAGGNFILFIFLQEQNVFGDR